MTEDHRAKAERAGAAADHTQFVARARNQHHLDQSDAAQVRAIRDTGNAVGQTKHYDKQARKFLKSRGY